MLTLSSGWALYHLCDPIRNLMFIIVFRDTYPWPNVSQEPDWPNLLKLRPEDVGYDSAPGAPTSAGPATPTKKTFTGAAGAKEGEANTTGGDGDPLVSAKFPGVLLIMIQMEACGQGARLKITRFGFQFPVSFICLCVGQTSHFVLPMSTQQ